MQVVTAKDKLKARIESRQRCGNLLCSFSKGSPPEPPDYSAAARQQGQANVDAARTTARLSNPNVVTPYGQQTVQFQGDQPTVTQQLSPEGQQLLDTQMGLSQQYGDLASQGFDRVQSQMGTPFDMGAVPEITTDPGVAGREAVTQALMDRQAPFLDRQRQQEENQLMIQGHNRGGSAWDAVQDDITRRETDARLASIMAGGQEQSRLYGLESADRSRGIQEQSFLRNLPLSEVNALRSGSQPNMPQFQGYTGTNVQAAPVYGAQQDQFAADMGRYNARAAQSPVPGLFDLGGSLLGAAGAAKGFGNLFSFT